MSDNWFKIGDEVPVVDPETGKRPERDRSGELRPTEFVSYEPLHEIEIQVDVTASASTRRFVDSTTEFLAMSRKPMAVTDAGSWESGYLAIVGKCVTGVRYVETGVEMTAGQRSDFFANWVEWEHVPAILFTIKRALSLSRAKKKNLSSLFG